MLAQTALPVDVTNDWLDYVTAGGSVVTLLAVLVALWPLLRERRREPDLDVEVEVDIATAPVGDNTPHRLNIGNGRNNDQARDVEVFVTVVGGDSKDGSKHMTYADKHPLTYHLEHEHVGRVTSMHIPAGFARPIDFMTLMPKHATAVNARFDRNNYPDEIVTTRYYDVVLTVTGSNFNAQTFKDRASVSVNTKHEKGPRAEWKWMERPKALSQRDISAWSRRPWCG